jgi:hypothetical protein
MVSEGGVAKKGGKKDARVATVAPGRLHFFGYRFPSTWLKNKHRGAAPPGVGIFFSPRRAR